MSLRSGSPEALHFWLAAAGCAAAALWSLVLSLDKLRRDRLIADTPLVRIRSAAQGYVKLFGSAGTAGSAPLTAPLSGRPCVWWSYQIQHKTQNSKGEAQWITLDSGASIEPFVLADAGAECLVGPVNAEITPTRSDVWYGTEARPSGPPPQSDYRLRNGNYRYTERLLCVGDRLSVIGELRSHSEIGSTESAAAALLQAWKHDQQGLLARFDKDHDGRIDAGEWDAARRQAAAESQAKTLRTPVIRNSVIGQSSNGQPFLIAAMDDVQLVRRERLRAAMLFAIGIGCIVLCGLAIEHARSLASALTAGG